MDQDLDQTSEALPAYCEMPTAATAHPIAIWETLLGRWITSHDVYPDYSTKIVAKAPPHLIIEATRLEPKRSVNLIFRPISNEEHPSFFESWSEVMKLHQDGYFDFPLGVNPNGIDGMQIFDYLPTYTLPNKEGLIYEAHLMQLLRWITTSTKVKSLVRDSTQQ